MKPSALWLVFAGKVLVNVVVVVDRDDWCCSVVDAIRCASLVLFIVFLHKKKPLA